MILRMLSVSVLALATGAMLETARASQFFVCDDGRTIEVARGDLETAKRENECVAKHFGLTIKKAKPAADQSTVPAKETAAPGSSPKLKIVLPVRKPKPAKLRATAAAQPRNRDRLSSTRLAAVPSASYRRVRVINAQTPSERWFLHTR